MRHVRDLGQGALAAGLLALGLVWLASGSGCSKGDAETSPAASSASAVTGVGGSSGCNGHFPDQYCVPLGPSAETCSCADCATAAMCTSACTDDDNCDMEGGEDCTCADCYFKVASCGPPQTGCQDDGECRFNESCTCADCTNTAFCTESCVDNGQCLPWLEGCSCADCAGNDACNGSSSNVTTGGGGGAGGAGGAAGSGGSGGAALSSSSASAGGAGGSGGA